jgi:hypothetical protein
VVNPALNAVVQTVGPRARLEAWCRSSPRQKRVTGRCTGCP